MSEICEFGILNKRSVTCKKDYGQCGYVRYCRTKSEMVMIPNYINCNWRKDMFLNKDEKEIELKEEVELEVEKKEEIKIEKPKKKTKKKNCKILFVAKGKAMVEMFGQNIRIKNVEGKKAGDFIEVKYIGTFGKEDFSIVAD